MGVKTQYFGHLMQRTDSFEKTLMPGKIKGRRRRGPQMMRWLNGITDSMDMFRSVQFNCCRVQLFATPWTAACQASLSITNSQSFLKLMSIKLVMPSNHLILCCPLLLLPSIFPSTTVFSNESALRIRWPKYRSFSFSITPSSEYSGLISFRMDCWISLQSKGLSKSSPTPQFKSINSLALSFLYGPTLTSIHDY